MKSGEIRKIRPLPLILLFCISSAVAIISGYTYFKNQKKSILDSSMQELSGITDLKVRQLTQWRKERTSDGAFLHHSASMSRQIALFLRNGKDENLKADLISDLKSLTNDYDYKDVLFIDKDLKVRLFYPNQDTVIGNFLLPRLKEVLRNGKVVLTDIHSTEKVSFVHLDLLVPLLDREKGDSSVIGLLVMRIDPQRIMFPLIKSWPVKSKTSESFIFSRLGDSIIYLSELRHVIGAPFKFRKPISEEKLAASMALKGLQATEDAIDYNGVPIIASMKQVPESTWYMLAKTDKDEIFGRLGNLQGNILFIVILLIILSLFLYAGFWRQQRLRYYRDKFEKEQEKLALEKHYEYILRYANDLILLLDKDFMIIEVNDRVVDTYQYSRDELIGGSVKVILSDGAINKLPGVKQMIDEKGFSIFESLHKRKSGEEIPVEISVRKVDIEGVTYYQSIMRNITERKMSQENIRESEEKFRKIFEDSPVGMVMTDKGMGILKANRAFCDMIGFTENELHEMTFRNFTHPDNVHDDEVALLHLVGREMPVYHTEKKYIRSDGSVIWGSTTVSIIRNNTGEVNFFLAMVGDITARKIAESDLEQSNSLKEATIESTADGILVVSSEGNIVLYNQRFAEMWSIPGEIMKLMKDESALSYVLDQLKHPEDFLKKVMDLYADPEAESFDFVEFRDGRYFERFSLPQKINGKSVGRVWSFRDITLQKKAETELIAAKEKAEESDRLKTAFLHNVSHEIRTPMNAILGFSTLLNEPGVTEEERRQYTDIIFQSGSQLLLIINDIVDLASIESGQVNMKSVEININTTLRRICDQFSYRQKPGGIVLKLCTPLPDKKADFFTDGTKLVQIISNLINNAFKFTEKGKISFGYEVKGEVIEMFVSDTGIGIPQEHLNRVFERFYQVDSKIARQYTGAGLGLSISKAYVELLGGKIWVNSEPDKGTEFRFTIPFRRK